MGRTASTVDLNRRAEPCNLAVAHGQEPSLKVVVLARVPPLVCCSGPWLPGQIRLCSSNQQRRGGFLARPSFFCVFLLLGLVHNFRIKDGGVWSRVHGDRGRRDRSQVHIRGKVGVGHRQAPDECRAVNSMGLAACLVVSRRQTTVQSSAIRKVLHAPRHRLIRAEGPCAVHSFFLQPEEQHIHVIPPNHSAQALGEISVLFPLLPPSGHPISEHQDGSHDASVRL